MQAVKNVLRPVYRKLYLKRTLYGPFAFIHINKCGGTSVERALRLVKMHDTARQRRDRIGAARWAQIPSFAIVRDPYEKVASHYRYRVKTNQTDLGSTGIELNEWVRRAYGAKEPELYNKPQMFAPCVDWVTDEAGEIMVDLVIRLEEIDRDWPKVEELIGRSAQLPKTNTTAGARKAARDAFDAQSLAIIEEHFRADFETFGYAYRDAA